jgi:hypothetical protein
MHRLLIAVIILAAAPAHSQSVTPGCLNDRFGEVRCSSAAKGSAALDRGGDAVCTEGCVAASAQACVTPSR